MTEHKITIKAKEMHKEEDGKSMIGFGVGVRYEGPNKNGITPEMAICGIGGLLTAIDLDEGEIEKITDGLTKQIIGGEKFSSMGDSFEEAESKAGKKSVKKSIESANDTFIRMIKDPKWKKVINNETDFSTKEMVNLKALAWIAVALRALKEADHEACARLEKLFLEDVAGLNEDEE